MSFDLPKGWGDDLLSEFQTIAFENELATFVHAPQWQQGLLDVATVLQKCSSYAMKSILNSEDPSALLLFLTARNYYLASVRSVTAGHCLAAYPIGRATVEAALYGWYLSSNKDAALRWNNKPTKREELKVWAKEFNFSNLTKNVSEVNEELAKWAKHLHQLAIDFGAHPNKDALYSNIVHEDGEDGAVIIKMVTLHPWNFLSISTTKFTIETGINAIKFFALGFPEGAQTLSLTQDLNRLTKNLSDLQDTIKLT